MNKYVISAAFALCSTYASAATILEYETAASVDNPVLGASSVGAGVTGGDMSAGSGVIARSGSTWVWRAWTNDDGSVNTTAAEAQSTDHFWTWGFSSTQAYDLSDFDIRLDRSSVGPNMFELLVSVNGGASTSVLSDDFGDSDSARNYYDVDLSAYSAVTSATFVLAAFGEDSGGASSVGTFDLERVAFRDYAFQLRGTAVSAVPLPLSGMLLLGGLAGFGVVRRRAASRAV